MAQINTGPQYGPQQAAVNNGLQGALYTINGAQAMWDKQLASLATQQKLSVQWSGSLKSMLESANQQTKAQTTSTEAIKSETTARKENTKSSSQENQARQAAKIILDREAIQRKKQLESDVLKNRLDIIQHASLGAALKHSRDIMAERSKVEQQLLKNTQEIESARSKQDVKKLNDDRNQLQKQLADNAKLTDAAQAALKAHTGGIASVSDAMGKFKKKLLDFSTGAAIGQAVRKTYEEAQSAKTTGNYANMGQFEQGQSDALLKVGVGSQVYNDIVANARAAQLTTSSFAEFNTHLKTGTDTMQTLTGSREEGAKLAGELYQNAGLVGITMADMGSRMDVLGDTFSRLTKLTGKTSAEMAQLSMSIMTDTDHRAVMLGMQNSERGEYVQKRTQDLESLKLQGFSIEQAQELQKMAMRARTQGLAEHVGKDAKASAHAYQIASMLGGKSGAQITGIQQQITALDREAAGGVTDKRAGEIEQQKAILRTQIVKAANEGRQARAMGTAERYTLNTALQDFTGNTDISEKNAAFETGSTEAQKRAKRDEGNIGGKGSLLNQAATIAGYTTALTKNTAALDLLTIVMGVNSAVGGVNALKGTPIASKFMNTALNAKNATITASEISGGSALARGAAGGGYAFDAMKASKLIKGVSLLAPIAGVVDGYSNYDVAKHNMGESVGLGIGSAAGSLVGGWGGAAAGAALGTMLLPGIGTIIGGALGGLGGGIGGDWLGGKAGKAIGSMADSTPAEKAKADAEAAIHPELAKSEQERSALIDLQKQYYTAGIEYYKKSDPLADKEVRAKHAEALHRIASHSTLNNAGWAASATQTGG